MQNDPLLQTLFHSPTGPIWKKIGVKKRHGINVPLFSLHSALSCGIGEYLDLIPLIDWCKKVPLDIIQLLPLNDSGKDPSPYNALSSCALHPIYLSLHALPHLDSAPHLKALIQEMRTFNQTKGVEYQEVRLQKLFFLREYWQIAGKKIQDSKEYREFIEENPWVNAYGLFLALKQELEYSRWQDWPKELCYIEKDLFDSLSEKHREEIFYYIGLQFLCFEQLKQAKKYANQNKILLKGDIPILISPDSVDVWIHKEWFDLHRSAGAPPDFYFSEGQHWGFPLFRWDVIEKDHYSFWLERLNVASNFYDIYRIDHIVGFFRIWAIDPGKSSKEGYFIPKDSHAWETQGKKLLTMMIHSSSMLPIGEDLGVIPPEVRTCMQKLGICGTKVMRWQRAWENDGMYNPIDEYPPLSMSSVSTHDSEPLTLWWQVHPEEAKVYAESHKWDYTPTLTQNQRTTILWESHHTSSLFHINLLSEYLAMFPDLVHEDPLEERINVPGIISKENWTYRFVPSIERIQEHVPLLEEVRKIILSPKPL